MSLDKNTEKKKSDQGLGNFWICKIQLCKKHAQ